VKALPSLQGLWNEYGGKGLHMFLLHSQAGSDDDVKKVLSKNGLTTAPVLMDRSGFSSYPGDNGLPFAYVIGVDGTVVFEGRGDYHAVVKTEMAKIKYPGLGKLNVAKGLEKAAADFVAKAFNKAIDACNKIVEKGKDEAAVEDAKFIIERCNAEGARIRAGVDKAKEEKRYIDAFAGLDVLALGFKGLELGDNAANELKELKKDKDVKREYDAAVALQKLIEGQKTMKAKSDKAKQLRDFAKKNDGTRASEDAKSLADKVEAGE